MSDPALACFEKYGGDLKLYRDIYYYISIQLNLNEISDVLGIDKDLVRIYRDRLKEAITDIPAADMVNDIFFTFTATTDTIIKDKIEMYMDMREDFNASREGRLRHDGRRPGNPQAKDIIELGNQISKALVDKIAVASKVLTLQNKSAAKPESETKKRIPLNELSSPTVDLDD